jgi:hypothetical protein
MGPYMQPSGLIYNTTTRYRCTDLESMEQMRELGVRRFVSVG